MGKQFITGKAGRVIFVVWMAVCLIMVPAAASASSLAIATGMSTTDGRPVAWKNRDHWSTPDGWQVKPFVYVADNSSFGTGDRYTARFNYMGVTSNGSSGIDPHTGTQLPWAGMNERGLGLVQVAGHTLTSDFASSHGYPVSQDLANGMTGGYLNHVILSRAEHVDEVEEILRDTNNGGGFNGSFARNTSTIVSVFDRWGNAATFEIDGDSFTRDNVTEEYVQDSNGYYSAVHNDDKDAPNPADGAYSGYDWRNNFSKVSWTKPNGFPYFVDNQITEVDAAGNVVNIGSTPDGIHDLEDSSSAVRRHSRTGIRMDDPHLKDYRYFIQKYVGSYGIGTKFDVESLAKNVGELPGTNEKATGFHLNRFVSTFGVVLVGSKIGDPYDGKLTTMWVALGEPAVSLFVPLFPYAGEIPPELNTFYLETNKKRHQVYDYTDDNSCGYSCGRNVDHEMDMIALAGGEYYGEGGIMKYTFDIENWMFEQYDRFMASLRDGTRTLAQLKSDMQQWQQSIVTEAVSHYVREVSLFGATEDAVIDSTNVHANDNYNVSVKHDTKKSYLKFNLTHISGKEIESVKLRLTESTDAPAGDTNFNILRSSGAWDEATLTWSNAPAAGTTVYGSYTGGQMAENEIIEIELHPSVLSGGDGELTLVLESVSGSKESRFELREGVYGPKLIVDFVNPNEIVVDNPQTVRVGTWSSSTLSDGYYGSNYYYNATGSGSDSITWTPNLRKAGNYKVYYRLPDGRNNRATNAKFTVHYDGGSQTFLVNQQVTPGGEWIQFGSSSFPFQAGTGGYVTLTDDADHSYVVADAIKFVME